MDDKDEWLSAQLDDDILTQWELCECMWINGNFCACFSIHSNMKMADIILNS